MRPSRSRFRQLPLRVGLFLLLLVSGSIPLVLVDVLLISELPRAGRLLETVAILAGSALLLVGLAWLFARWGAAAILEPVGRLSTALRRGAKGQLGTWVSPGSGISELTTLCKEFNEMSARTLETVHQLRKTERDNARLATDSMRLIQEAVVAKQPLTKRHPGLLEAYSRALARQLGQTKEQTAEPETDETVRGLSEFLDTKDAETVDRREQPRYQVTDLLVDNPVGAKILDVGATGMGIETLASLTVGRHYRFEVLEGSRRLAIPVRAAWSRLVRTLKTDSGDLVAVYRAGISFSDSFSAAEREELLEIIQSHRDVA